MTRTRLRGLGAAGALGALMVGPPVGLVLAGMPLPRRWPDWSNVSVDLHTGYLPAVFVTHVGLVAAWLAWAFLAYEISAEISSWARRAMSRRSSLLGPLQPVLARLAATAVLSLPAFSRTAPAPPAPAAALVIPPTRDRPYPPDLPRWGLRFIRSADTDTELVSDLAAQPSSPTPERGQNLLQDPGQPASLPVYTVVRGDTLWGIAARHLGDPRRWSEIAELNAGRFEGSARFSNPHWIYPGWALVLPADATGVVPAPASAAGVGATPMASPAASGTAEALKGSSEPSDRPAPVPITPARARRDEDRRPEGGRDENGDRRVAEASAALALLGAGLVVAIARLRRAQQRARRLGRRIPLPTGPGAAAELALGDAADTALATATDRSLRQLSAWLAGVGMVPAEIAAVRVDGPGQLSLRTIDPGVLEGVRLAPDSEGWAAVLPIDSPTGDDTAAFPLPGLVSVGADAGRPVLLNLEAAGLVSLSGELSDATATAGALALELASSPWADAADLYVVGVPAPPAAWPEVTFTEDLDGVIEALVAHGSLVAEQLADAGAPSVSQARLVDPGPDWRPTLAICARPLEGDELEALAQLRAAGWPPAVVLVAPNIPGATWTIELSEKVIKVHPLELELGRATTWGQDFSAAVFDLLVVATVLGDVAPDTPPYDRLDPSIRPRAAMQPDATATATATVVDHGDIDDVEVEVEDDGVEIEELELGDVGDETEDDPELGDVGNEAEHDFDLGDAPIQNVEDLEVVENLDVALTAIDQGEERDPSTAEKNAPGETDTAGRDLEPCPAPEAGGPVSIDVLGPPLVRGQAVEPRRPKTLQLLFWVATHPHALRRDEALGDLWPNSRPTPDTIYGVWSDARRVLGLDSAGKSHLPRRAPEGLLGPEVSSDWRTFCALSDSDDPADWFKALGLVRGMPFAGVDYGWAGVVAHVITARIVDTAIRLVDHGVAVGQPQLVRFAAEAALAAVSYDERPYRALMQAADLEGNRLGVRAVMDRLRKAVGEEIADGDPFYAETLELYRRLTTPGRADTESGPDSLSA